MNSKIYFRILFLLLVILFYPQISNAQLSNVEVRAPENSVEIQENIPTKINIKDVPSFPQEFARDENGKKLVGNIKLPLDLRLRLAVDSSVDPKKTIEGDYFKAHVIEDLYLPTEPKQIIALKGSWLRGRVTYIKKPTFFSMSGGMRIKLDQLTTPMGEIIPINTRAEIQKGYLNEKGLYEPIYSEDSTDLNTALLNDPRYINIPDSYVTPSLIGKLLNGGMYALFLEGKDYQLLQGQELQLVLRKNINIDVK